MTKPFSRKMGVLEKLSTVIHDNAAGSTSVAGRLAIKRAIDFALFKQAWRILFDRQPLLRATIRVDLNGEYFFDLNANFSDIPITYKQTDDSQEVEQVYSRDIIKMFESDSYLWRAALISGSEESVIVFGSIHSISDAKSISYLLGDLLRIILELEQGMVPNASSYDMTDPLDVLLDLNQFSLAGTTQETAPRRLLMEKSVAKTAFVSKNQICFIEPDDFICLHKKCRDHDVTINSALAAALVISLTQILPGEEGAFYLPFAVNFRPYTKTKMDNQTLAFYAHMVEAHIQHPEQSFWIVAKEAHLKCRAALAAYQLPPNNLDFFDGLKNTIAENYANGCFFGDYCFTNVGLIDDSFKGCECFGIHDFCFTVLNQGIFGVLISAATVNNRLSLNFNYAVPALSDKTVRAIIDKTMRLILTA